MHGVVLILLLSLSLSVSTNRLPLSFILSNDWWIIQECADEMDACASAVVLLKHSFRS